MAAALWKLGVIVTPDGQINQLSNSNIDMGIARALVRGDGKLSPQFGAVSLQDPSATFSSSAIKRILDMITCKGKGYATASYFYLAQKLFGGHLVSGSYHSRMVAPKCLIVPRTLSATHGEIATIDCAVYMISADGSAAAISYGGTVALPAATASDQAYTLGPAKINGSSLGQLSSLRIDFGIREKVMGFDGLIFPVWAHVESQTAEITVTTSDPTILNSLVVPTGTNVSAASYVYLRKKSNGGGNVADGTAEHIKFELKTMGLFDPTALSQNDESETTLEVKWTPLDDQVNDLLALSTAAAIA